MSKHSIHCLTILLILICLPFHSQAQIIEKAEEIITGILNNPKDSVLTDAELLLETKRMEDSLRMEELARELNEMKLNEMMLRSELEQALKFNETADSLKRMEQRRRIDSLRVITPGVPVIIGNDTLFRVYAQRGGLSPADRVNDIQKALLKIGESYSVRMDSVHIYDTETVTDIMYGKKVIAGFTDIDGLWQNMSRQELANHYLPVITETIVELRKINSIQQVMKRVLLFILVVIAQYFLLRLTSYLFKKLKRRIIWVKQNKLKSISIKEYEFLDTHRQGRLLLFFTNLLKWLVIIIQLAITIPILFSIFPQTEDFALKIFSYIFEPVASILRSMVNYLPKLFTILVIFFCFKYLVKGVQYLAKEIETERLKITGFYPDWAQPTFNIVRFLLYAFMIAMIYPNLPGAESDVFQGISVFVGIIVSLGSTTVIANVMAGLVITYMRPFRIGDRIKLNDTTGNVIEKTPFVTRLRTPKNEVVTIPNSFIMSSHTTNYSESARQNGLIIHTNVTYGYEVPWRQVHELLVRAALATPGVMQNPKPFVLETELHDYYPIYQINAYIKDADKLAQIYSDLYQNIQDLSNEAGIELMSPHYYAGRDGNASTLPPEYVKNKK